MTFNEIKDKIEEIYKITKDVCIDDYGDRPCDVSEIEIVVKEILENWPKNEVVE